jgi:hypothetical protein
MYGRTRRRRILEEIREEKEGCPARRARIKASNVAEDVTAR